MTTAMRCYQCQKPIVPGQHYYMAMIDGLVMLPAGTVHLACWQAWKKANPLGVASGPVREVTP